MISKKSLEMIIHHEIGGRAYYEKKLQAPIWAGGESGVTIGMGYDLGYNSEKQFIPIVGRKALIKFKFIHKAFVYFFFICILQLFLFYIKNIFFSNCVKYYIIDI